MTTAGAGFGFTDGFPVATGVRVALGLGEVSLGCGAVVPMMTGVAGIVLTMSLVRSRPARSMATQAVADTPMTAASQIAAMPLAERRVMTICPTVSPSGRRACKTTSSARRSVLLCQLSC